MSVALLRSMEPRRDLNRLSRQRTSRCIFGPCDPAELNRKYERCSREKMQRFKEEWGFDPETERPVPNHERFEWESVGAASTSTEEAPQPPPAPLRERRDSSPDGPSVSAAAAPESPKSLKQTALPDFFAGRKRSGTASDSLAKKQQRLSAEGSSSSSSSSPPPAEEGCTSSSQQVN